MIAGVTTMVMATAAAPIDADTRAAIVDSARAPAVAELGKPVLLRVAHLKASGDWAFLRADMQGPGGAPIDYAGTPLAEAARNGAVSPVYAALLRREGGAWQVVAHAVGPTDVAWDGWAGQYGAPRDIFG